MTSAPGWAFSHFSSVHAPRSGSRSVTSPDSASATTVPYARPLRSAKSFTPVTCGAALTSGSGSGITSRSTVEGCTAIPRVPASRAPARPASSSPNPASMPSSGTLRRRHRSLSPPACSAQVTAGHCGFPAAEPAHLQDDPHRPATRRAVRQHARIPAVQPRRLLTAPRAARPVGHRRWC